MSAQTLARLDMAARLFIAAGAILILLDESIGIAPAVVGLTWMIARLLGRFPPKAEETP